MNTQLIAESFRLRSAQITGYLQLHLHESVRKRYRKLNVEQECYELVIDAHKKPKVKRASKDGKVMSIWEAMRFGLFRRFAVITNQPVISPLAPSLVMLDDNGTSDGTGDVAIWRLLPFDIEWKVESSERFYLYFLRQRAFVSEVDVLVAIASDLYSACNSYLHSLALHGALDRALSDIEPVALDNLSQEQLNKYVLPHLNQRIMKTGVTIRRFHQASIDRAISAAEISFALNPMQPTKQGTGAPQHPLRGALIDGLLAHLCRPLAEEDRWLEQLLQWCGYELSFDEVRAALQQPISQQASSKQQGVAPLRPAVLLQRLIEAGRAQIRQTNRMLPGDTQQRYRLRRKASSLLQLALLLSEAPRFTAEKGAGLQSKRLQILAMTEALRDTPSKHCAEITFRPGSTVNLMAVAVEARQQPTVYEGNEPPPLELVREILPLLTDAGRQEAGAVTVATAAAAAAHFDFAGAAAETSLILQVLEPGAGSSGEAINREAIDSILFWGWRVRAAGEKFTVRLRSTRLSTHYEIELDNAEFVDKQPARSTEFPIVPHFRRSNKPLELALLIDGYWLVSAPAGGEKQQTGLSLLTHLLEQLDEQENASKSGLLIYAAISLDEHLSAEFTTRYGEVPSLYTLGDEPMETIAQLVAEWLQPWVERWNGWEIKPYPVDTDIALDKGFQYLNQLQWQPNTQPQQRALLLAGRSRPHEHANYFAAAKNHQPFARPTNLDAFDIPYHPEDRFSVTERDWRAELHRLRSTVGTIVALCDPGMPNPRYHLGASHPLLREYRDFWTTVDPGILLDLSEQSGLHTSAMGSGRVLQTLDERFFRRRAVRLSDPPLSLPFSPFMRV